MVYRRAALLCLCIFLNLQGFGQRIITGKVLDIHTKEPLENISVTTFKAPLATSTNSRGFFQLTITDEDSLLLTHKDYETGILAIPEVDVFSTYLKPYDRFPMYLEGTAKLYQYLNSNLQYPQTPFIKSIEGLLLVELIIDERGKIADCRCLNKLSEHCEKKTLKVFRQIPGRWEESKAMNSFIFPVVFVQDDEVKTFAMPQIELPKGKVMGKIIVKANNG